MKLILLTIISLLTLNQSIKIKSNSRQIASSKMMIRPNYDYVSFIFNNMTYSTINGTNGNYKSDIWNIYTHIQDIYNTSEYTYTYLEIPYDSSVNISEKIPFLKNITGPIQSEGEFSCDCQVKAFQNPDIYYYTTIEVFYIDENNKQNSIKAEMYTYDIDLNITPDSQVKGKFSYSFKKVEPKKDPNSYYFTQNNVSYSGYGKDVISVYFSGPLFNSSTNELTNYYISGSFLWNVTEEPIENNPLARILGPFSTESKIKYNYLFSIKNPDNSTSTDFSIEYPVIDKNGNVVTTKTLTGNFYSYDMLFFLDVDSTNPNLYNLSIVPYNRPAYVDPNQISYTFNNISFTTYINTSVLYFNMPLINTTTNETGYLYGSLNVDYSVNASDIPLFSTLQTPIQSIGVFEFGGKIDIQREGDYDNTQFNITFEDGTLLSGSIDGNIRIYLNETSKNQFSYLIEYQPRIMYRTLEKSNPNINTTVDSPEIPVAVPIATPIDNNSTIKVTNPNQNNKDKKKEKNTEQDKKKEKNDDKDKKKERSSDKNKKEERSLVKNKEEKKVIIIKKEEKKEQTSKVNEKKHIIPSSKQNTTEYIPSTSSISSIDC